MAQGNTLVKELRTVDEETPRDTSATQLAEQRTQVLPAARIAKPSAAMLDMNLGPIRYSDTFADLALALASAQGEFQEIEKKRVAKVESRREGARSYSYTYADLSDVLLSTRPALSKNAIALLQFPRVTNKQVIVTTILIHGASGEWIAGDSLPVQLDNFDPQAGGSAQTYARRYGLCSMLGLAPGDADDDGELARRKVADTGEPPEGFEATWLDLEMLADEGWPRVEEAWAKCNGAFKNFVAKYRKDQWNALKAKALGVKSK
jgi:hypothetical protein